MPDWPERFATPPGPSTRLALTLDDVVAVVGRPEDRAQVRRRDAVRRQQRAQLLHGSQVRGARRADACAREPGLRTGLSA